MHDLRLALRTLRKTPVVSAVAILSLALGIGANTAVFSLVESLVLRALPVDEPDRLVLLTTGSGDEHQQYSNRTVDRLREFATDFDGVCSWAFPGRGMLGAGPDGRVVDRQFVSGDYFRMLGVRPAAGRLLTPSDDAVGGGPDGLVAVISYAFWQSYFDGRPQVVGSRVLFERLPVTIVGVTPRGFSGVIVGRSFDIAVPVRAQPTIMAATPYPEDGPWLRVMLRLRSGQSFEEATAAIRAIQPAIRAGSMPGGPNNATFLKEPFRLAPAGAGVSPLREKFERPLLVLFAAVGLVLVIASVNVANLTLVRGAARRHEMAVRLALGASRWRLARQLLVESAMLSAAGTVAALAFTAFAGRAIVAQLSTFATPIALDPGVDGRVIAFTTVTMIATTLLFGVIPALRAAAVAPASVIQASARQGGAGSGAGRFAGGLIVVQVAVSLTLIVTAGLFMQSFARLVAAPLGFERDRAIVAAVESPTVAGADRNALYRRLVATLAVVPGVSAAAGSANPPIVGTLLGNFVVSAPGTPAPPDAESFSQSSYVTPGFVQAYGMTLGSGRDFDDGVDTPTSPKTIIVNDAFVRRYLGGQDAVGRAVDLTYRMSSQGDYRLGTTTIVGVVSDSAYRSVRDRGGPTVYFSLGQDRDPILQSTLYVAVRAAAPSPMLLARTVTEAITAVNPELRVTVHSVAEQVDASLAQDRLVALLASFFSVLAMVLAALGLYGMTAYSVSRRRMEIGIRMALGATPAGILWSVATRVAIVVVLGTIVGIGAALATARAVSSLLYGVDARDPTTLAVSAAALAIVGGLAAYVPARHAARVEPASVLHES
jgi:predicted permease